MANDQRLADISAERAAIAKKLSGGVRQWSYGDRSTQYDFDTLRRRDAELAAEADILNRPVRVRRILTYSTKGY